MSYHVTSEADDIVIRLPRGETDERALSELLSYLELHSLWNLNGTREKRLPTGKSTAFRLLRRLPSSATAWL